MSVLAQSWSWPAFANLLTLLIQSQLARTMDARRENLKATVAALIDRLALSENEKLLLLTQERRNL
jgi:hypothetical protein